MGLITPMKQYYPQWNLVKFSDWIIKTIGISYQKFLYLDIAAETIGGYG